MNNLDKLLCKYDGPVPAVVVEPVPIERQIEDHKDFIKLYENEVRTRIGWEQEDAIKWLKHHQRRLAELSEKANAGRVLDMIMEAGE